MSDSDGKTGEIVKSQYPDIDENAGKKTLPAFCSQDWEEFGDKAALVDGISGNEVSYKQLGVLVKKVASGLYADGFRKNDVLALCMPNCIPYPIAFHAIMSLGAAATTMNPLYKPREMRHQLEDTKAKAIFTVAPFLASALEVAKDLDAIKQIYLVGPGETGDNPLVKSYNTLLANDGTGAPEEEIDPEETVAVLPYSSGTSGLPKGVMLSHRSIATNVLQVTPILRIEKEYRVLAVLPMFHVYGIFAFMTYALWKGATVIILPKFDPQVFLTTLQKYKVTNAHIVPPIVVFLAKHPIVDNFDLGELKTIVSAAAPLGQELAEQCAARLGVNITQAYGMTELSPGVTASEDTCKKYSSCGRLLPNTLCKIISVEDGHLCKPGEHGELCFKGPQVMKGYLNNPEATKAMIDDDGFLHTGDVGYIDEDGDFFIVDRVKELIKYKGFQIAPAELEDLLLRHDAVADAAVVPVPTEETGESPKGFVVLKPGKAATEEDIIKFIADQVAPYKKLRFVEFVEAIPKSASGKILRRVLKEKEREKAKASA